MEAIEAMLDLSSNGGYGTMNKNGKMVGGWEISKILEVLEMKNAMSAMRGRPCPVAVSVVARISAAA